MDPQPRGPAIVSQTGEATRTSSPHWPALDGWRGLTIWFAISVHAGYFTAGGVLSLDTFFTLSGFLITGILLREWLRGDAEGAGHINLPSFWARRARRLLPALFVLLAAVLVYAAFVAPKLGLDKVRGDVLGSLFYVANWRFILSGQSYFGAFTSPSPVLHLWSLAVEEQFYLFWPPIVLGVLWLARRRVRATGAVVAVGVVALLGAVASAVLMASLYVPGGDPSRVYYGTDTRAQAMLMGAALAVVVTLHGPLRSQVGRRLLSAAARRRDRRRVPTVVRVERDARARPLLRTVRAARVLVRDRNRHLAPRPAVSRSARAWPGAASRRLGRRDLLRDVPVALAHIPRGRPRADGALRPVPAHRSAVDGGRARRGHALLRRGTHPARCPDPDAATRARRSPRRRSSRSASGCSRRRSARVLPSAATSARSPTVAGPRRCRARPRLPRPPRPSPRLR